MWNNIALKPPPTNSYYGDHRSVDTTLLKTTLDDFVTKIGHCKDALHLEAALLSRIIYRLKIKFRSDLGMRFMAKINKSLHTYLNMEIAHDVKHFLKSVPLKKVGDTYLPTKQMFEYILVRIQGFSKVMTRIIETAGETAYFMTTRMKLGHFWNVALIVLSLVSRIWEISQHIIDACCKCYVKILPIRKQLQLKGINWLEEGYVFPTDLRSWLNLKWSQEDLNRITQQHLNLPVYVLSDDEDEDDIQFCFQYKNDCIIIDDDLKITDDDVQFVNEYIDIIEKNNENRKRVRAIISQDNGESIVELDSDVSLVANSPNDNNNQTIIENNNSDIEIIEPAQLILDDDIGEAISRKRKRKKKGKNTETQIQEGVLNKIRKRKNLSLVEIDSTPKRLRTNETIVTIPDTPSSTSTVIRLPEQNNNRNSPFPSSPRSFGINETIVTIPDTPLSTSTVFRIQEQNNNSPLSLLDDSDVDMFNENNKRNKKTSINSTPNSNKVRKRDKTGNLSFNITPIRSIRDDREEDISDSNNETLKQKVESIMLKKKKSKKKGKKSQPEESTIELSSVADSEDSILTIKRTSFKITPKSQKSNRSSEDTETDSSIMLKKKKSKKSRKSQPEESTIELSSLADSEDSTVTVKLGSFKTTPKSKKPNKSSYTETDSSVDLTNFTTIRDINAFLAREKKYRDTKNPNRLSVNLGKAKWTQLIKSIEKIFSTRKVLKQDKKLAVKLAKDMIQFYIKS